MPVANALTRAIEAAGGAAAFLAAVGVSTRTLASWRKWGVPDTQWGRVVAASRGAVTADELARDRAAALTPANDAAPARQTGGD